MNDDEPPGDLLWLPDEPKFALLLQCFAAECRQVYVVGGAVRDAMYRMQQQTSVVPPQFVSNSSKPASDLDLVVPDHACKVARKVADRIGWAFYKLDAERDIARLVDTRMSPPLVCDVARFQAKTLTEDLAARDFSINAMAFEVADGNERVTLIDNHNGLHDLRQKQIRRVDVESMERDPVRLLRAVRFAAQFGFTIEQQTRTQILEKAPAIVESSQERIRDELWKALATRHPDRVIEELRSLGLLEWILPEVAGLVDVPQSSPHFLDVYQHTLLAVRHAGFLRDWILRDNDDINLSASNPVRVPEPGSVSVPNDNIKTLVDEPSQSKVDDREANDYSVGATGGGNYEEFGDEDYDDEASEYRVEVYEPLALLTSSLEKWIPQLRTHFGHQLSAGHARCEWLVWLALFHDVGKPATRTEEVGDTGLLRHRFFEHEEIGARLTSDRLNVLHFSRDEVKLASKAVASHMRPHHLDNSFPQKPISRRSTYRFFRDLGQIQGDSLIGVDVVLLALADRLAIHRLLNLPFTGPPLSQLELDPVEKAPVEKAPVEKALMEIDPVEVAKAIEQWGSYITHMDQLLSYAFDDAGIPAISRPRLVDGNLLMEHLDMKPGPEMGKLLEQIAEAQATGEIETVDEALKWAADQTL